MARKGLERVFLSIYEVKTEFRGLKSVGISGWSFTLCLRVWDASAEISASGNIIHAFSAVADSTFLDYCLGVLSWSVVWGCCLGLLSWACTPAFRFSASSGS